MPRPKRSVRKRAKRPSRRITKLVPYGAIKKHNKRREPSSLEKRVYQMLQEEGIPYEREKAISRLHVDIFLAPKTVIELQGCHWHGCLVCNKKPSQDQQIAILKDGRRQAVLRKRGYDVVTIWEHEVNDHPERVQAMLKGIWTGIRRERSE